MKKLFTLTLLITFAVSGECMAKNTAEKAPAAIKKQALPLQHNLFLPKDIYAVPGLESNIYFKNIFYTINHANYVFDVDCRIGRNDAKRWTYVPNAADAGKTFPLTVKVYDMNGQVAEASTTVHVGSADAGKGKAFSILMIGDSLTTHAIFPARVHHLCKQPGNPALTMVGALGYGGKPAQAGGVAHEGYGGWTWRAFLVRYIDREKLKNPTPLRILHTRSKFIVKKNGKITVDIPGYFKKYNKGKAADVITFQLGVNDIFRSTEANLEKNIKLVLGNADRLIAEFRKAAPDAVIGVGFVTPCSSQDSFGRNYGCSRHRKDYFRNHFRLNQAMAEHFAKYKDSKLFMIPVNTGLDTENNFPAYMLKVNRHNKTRVYHQVNGVHPSADGYKQMGDVYYSWIKNLFTNKVLK